MSLPVDSNPKGIAVDSQGNAWVDAKQNIWVANFGTNVPSMRYSIVQLCGSVSTNCPSGVGMDAANSPSMGHTLPSAGSEVLLSSG